MTDIGSASDTVGLAVPEGRQYLTDKTLAALRHSFSKFGRTVDWYMKADDGRHVRSILLNISTTLVSRCRNFISLH